MRISRQDQVSAPYAESAWRWAILPFFNSHQQKRNALSDLMMDAPAPATAQYPALRSNSDGPQRFAGVRFYTTAYVCIYVDT